MAVLFVRLAFVVVVAACVCGALALALLLALLLALVLFFGREVSYEVFFLK